MVLPVPKYTLDTHSENICNLTSRLWEKFHNRVKLFQYSLKGFLFQVSRKYYEKSTELKKSVKFFQLGKH